MRREEACNLARGYAWGREDASGVVTAEVAERLHSPVYQFSEAYAGAWQEFNDGARGSMWPVRDAYEAWQSSGGLTCEPEYERAARERAAARRQGS